ncbi:MAG TPA: hypothetical protein VFQ57_02335 [Sphingomonas sp.]|jgi:hypothetical protein|nr:hypothetical protein [Sphingomonas sp.]
MLPMLLLAAFQSQGLPPTSTGDLVASASGRLAITCGGRECAPRPASDLYRVDASDDSAMTSKDRAFRDDGSRCQVVGAKLCTRQPRKIFSTGIGQ